MPVLFWCAVEIVGLSPVPPPLRTRDRGHPQYFSTGPSLNRVVYNGNESRQLKIGRELRMRGDGLWPWVGRMADRDGA
jgi:hypothetical protein